MLENMIMPGEPDLVTQDRGEYLSLAEEMALFEKARDMGLFAALRATEHRSIDFSTLHDVGINKPLGFIHSKLNIIHAAGLLSTTPQAFVVPTDCRFIRIESTGRVSVSSHDGKPATASESLDVAFNNRSIASIGPGRPKTIVSPQPGTTIFLSAFPNNSETTLTFITGDDARVMI